MERRLFYRREVLRFFFCVSAGRCDLRSFLGVRAAALASTFSWGIICFLGGVICFLGRHLFLGGCHLFLGAPPVSLGARPDVPSSVLQSLAHLVRRLRALYVSCGEA